MAPAARERNKFVHISGTKSYAIFCCTLHTPFAPERGNQKLQQQQQKWNSHYRTALLSSIDVNNNQRLTAKSVPKRNKNSNST